MAKTTTETQLSRIRKQRELLDQKEKALLAKTNGAAINKILQLAKKEGVTLEQISEAMGRGKKPNVRKAKATKGHLAGRKVPPKYRNPTNNAQTWSGRGVSPLWIRELKSRGEIELALIPSSGLVHEQ